VRTKCSRVTSVTDFAFKQSNNSLSGDDIRDILMDDADVFKGLLEECLLAKQIVLSLFDKVASEFEFYKLGQSEAIAIYNAIFGDLMDNAMAYFPLLLKQKLLVTACKHPSKNVFGPLPIPSVDAFAVDGKIYPTILDKSYAEDELNDIASGALRGYLMNATISSLDCTITTGPIIDGIVKIGLMIDDYHIVDDNYMQACYVASFILQRNVFARIGKLHVKSLSGISEKI